MELQYSRGAEGEDCDGAAMDYAARRHAGVGPGEGAHDQPESWGARGQLRPGPEEDGTSGGATCAGRRTMWRETAPGELDPERGHQRRTSQDSDRRGGSRGVRPAGNWDICQ